MKQYLLFVGFLILAAVVLANAWHVNRSSVHVAALQLDPSATIQSRMKEPSSDQIDARFYQPAPVPGEPLSVNWDPAVHSYELGLRADGVVVWREAHP